MIPLNATYQQTKRVVDPVWGTYQTVLTIDPSVSQSDIVGTYNCTVENARGVSFAIPDSGELIIPYKHYLRVTGYSACTYSSRNIKFNICKFTLNSHIIFFVTTINVCKAMW